MCCCAGPVQVCVRHAGGVCGVRQLVVSGIRALSASQTEVRQESIHQDQRLPARVPGEYINNAPRRRPKSAI